MGCSLEEETEVEILPCQASVDTVYDFRYVAVSQISHITGIYHFVTVYVYIFDITGAGHIVASCHFLFGIRIYFLLVLEDTVCLITVVAVDGTSGFSQVFGGSCGLSHFQYLVAGISEVSAYGVTDFTDVMIERQVGIDTFILHLADIFKREFSTERPGHFGSSLCKDVGAGFFKEI